LTEGTGRLEAFSDGVFAIAVTLLILEIRLPHAGVEGSLWKGLAALWPSYFAFVLSFFVILVTWITHHDLMRLVRTTNRPVQLANGLALLYVTFIPFPTAVLAAHLGGEDMSTAVAFYCGTFVYGSFAFNVLVATISRGQLFFPEVSAHQVGRIQRGYRITFAIYLARAQARGPAQPLACAGFRDCGKLQAKLKRLREVIHPHRVRSREIGDRPRDTTGTEDASRRDAQRGRGALEEPAALPIERRRTLEFGIREIRVSPTPA
jgi:uncharacterized membrane protein